jgi:hypothetical protein
MSATRHGKFIEVFFLDIAFQDFLDFSGKKGNYLNITGLEYSGRSLTESSTDQYPNIQFFKQSEKPVKHGRLKQLYFSVNHLIFPDFCYQ